MWQKKSTKATKLLLSIVVFLITFFIYFVSGKNYKTKHHFFIPLADAFLKKRLYVEQMTPFLHEMVSKKEVETGLFTKYGNNQKGKFYVIYPPMPGVLLMPAVFIFGLNFNQSLFSIFIASINSVLAFHVFKNMKLDTKKSLWLTFLYGLGSMQWYHSIIGSAWYYAAISALFFLWLSLLLLLKNKDMFFIGLFLGMAYLCRYPVILSLPFFLIISSKHWFKQNKINFNPLLKFVFGLGIIFLISFAYNLAIYKSIWPKGYGLLEKRAYNINNEYRFGSYSLKYLPRHVLAIFWSWPKKIHRFPYVAPNYWSMSLWFVMPALFIIFSAPFKNKVVFTSFITIILMLLPAFVHGGIGATQFGYRYALDVFPFLFVIFAQAIKKNLYLWQKSLIILSFFVNLWGIYMSFWY